MHPIDFPQANMVFTAPKGEETGEGEPIEGVVGDLHVCSAQQRLSDCPEPFPVQISCWKPSDEEKKLIAKGANIYLFVYGEGHPAVALTTQLELGQDPHAEEDTTENFIRSK